MRRAARIDDNQREVVRALRAAGAMVVSTASLGGGFPDLAVIHNGRVHLLEVKDGSKPPSSRRLTPLEEGFAMRTQIHGYWVHVVTSSQEALRAIGVLT